jgi:hypothetical protein
MRKSKSDPLSWTLRFKKHKTTVLLVLPSTESIQSTKGKLLAAVKARGVKEINGDPVPDDPSEIEFGVPVDRNELEKGWTRLDTEGSEFISGDAPHASSARRKHKPNITLRSADIKDGQPIAFRFRNSVEMDENRDELELELEDPGWDVIIPTLDDDEPE